VPILPRGPRRVTRGHVPGRLVHLRLGCAPTKLYFPLLCSRFFAVPVTRAAALPRAYYHLLERPVTSSTQVSEARASGWYIAHNLGPHISHEVYNLIGRRRYQRAGRCFGPLGRCQLTSSPAPRCRSSQAWRARGRRLCRHTTMHAHYHERT
jgi:hypothetical protein